MVFRCSIAFLGRQGLELCLFFKVQKCFLSALPPLRALVLILAVCSHIAHLTENGQIEAYKGVLEFRLGHGNHMGTELSRDKSWGVIIEGRSHVISAKTSVGFNSLAIAEDGGWTVTKGNGLGHAPTQSQLIGLLSDVTAIKVRGQWFSMAEMTWIGGVVLRAGAEDASKLREQLKRWENRRQQQQAVDGPGELVGYVNVCQKFSITTINHLPSLFFLL